MNEKRFKIMEIVAVPVIYLIATLLHFVYDLSNGSALSILFGSVNESVWEHIKIFSVGFVVYSTIELLAVKPPFKKFIVAKTVALYALGFFITALYYTYNFFFKNNTSANLIIAFVSVCISQYISYRLVTTERNTTQYFSISAMLLILYFVMFFSFTIFPPQLDLFKDPVTNTYGIMSKIVDAGAFFLNKK